MSKVMLIGLASGEQIVGKVADPGFMDHIFILVKNPAILVAGEQGLGMGPWLMYSNANTDGVTVNVSNIVFAVEPRIEIVNQYNAQYGNGLVLPNKQVETPELSLTTE